MEREELFRNKFKNIKQKLINDGFPKYIVDTEIKYSINNTEQHNIDNTLNYKQSINLYYKTQFHNNYKIDEQILKKIIKKNISLLILPKRKNNSSLFTELLDRIIVV